MSAAVLKDFDATAGSAVYADDARRRAGKEQADRPLPRDARRTHAATRLHDLQPGRDPRGREVAFHGGEVAIEFTERGAILDVNGQQQEVPNDFVWIFAGGVAPNDFLKRIGVQFGSKDLTAEAGAEAREASVLVGAGA